MLAADVVHHLELIPLALIDRLQTNVDRRDVLGSRRVVRHGHQRELDFGQLADSRGDPVGDDLGRIDGRAFRRTQPDLELRLVVVRQEVLVREHEQRHAAQQHQHGQPGDRPAVAERPREQRRCSARSSGLKKRESFGRRFLDLVSFGILAPRAHLDPPRRQHRRQREADEHRHQDGERHREAEARHEAADDAAHESDRDEDRHQRQRRRQHRETDLARRLDRRLHRRPPLLLDEAIDVLQHHDRVVDDDADGERQRQHRHRVEREALEPDQAEGRDDRRRDGDRGDERRAPVPQEHEHDAQPRGSSRR